MKQPDKKYLIYCNTEKKHLFTIDVIESGDDVTYKLSRSHDDTWSEPGEELLSLSDDGNGVKFDRKINKNLDYSDLGHLRLLLNFADSRAHISDDYDFYVKDEED